eukprot:TRINITY_DN22547_c0_g1_i2.p1 TRINITY_DN22547_c0_g1~~TRINITY_DN22547_c0_g1_i2.p1  ORF type:complete len:293 (-),score=34.22 TRINITY_DN22547_c0_g1_i2:34-843(-)
MIENRFNQLTNMLKGADKAMWDNDLSRNGINLSKCLTELTLKTLQIKHKVYWEIKRYAHERIKDPQDVTELFLTPKLKELFDSINDENAEVLAEEIKRVINEKAGRIAYAEKRVKFIKEDYLLLWLKKQNSRQTKTGRLKTQGQIVRSRNPVITSEGSSWSPNKMSNLSPTKVIRIERQELVKEPCRSSTARKVNYTSRATKLISRFTQYQETFADVEKSCEKAREMLRRTSTKSAIQQKRTTSKRLTTISFNRFKRKRMSLTYRRLYT